MSFCTLGTYDVQAASFKPAAVAGTVIISGERASNTTALGCLIVIKSSSTVQYEVAIRKNDSCIATVSYLERNVYSVLVYDLEGNGLPGSTPAVSMTGVAVSESSAGQLRNT